MAWSSKATVMAVGWPAATSCAKLGPLSEPTGSVSSTSASEAVMTCDMRRNEALSVLAARPLVALRRMWRACMWLRRRPMTGRRNSLGMTETRMSAYAMAASSPVTAIESGRRMPGRYLRFSRALAMVRAASCECDQSVMGRPLRASDDAIAVPQEPEPRTAMRGAMGRIVMEKCYAVLGVPKRFSVPLSSRPMLAWCFTMISPDTMIWTATKKAGLSPCTKNHAKMGKLAAPRMDASET